MICILVFSEVGKQMTAFDLVAIANVFGRRPVRSPTCSLQKSEFEDLVTDLKWTDANVDLAAIQMSYSGGMLALLFALVALLSVTPIGQPSIDTLAPYFLWIGGAKILQLAYRCSVASWRLKNRQIGGVYEMFGSTNFAALARGPGQ